MRILLSTKLGFEEGVLNPKIYRRLHLWIDPKGAGEGGCIIGTQGKPINGFSWSWQAEEGGGQSVEEMGW